MFRALSRHRIPAILPALLLLVAGLPALAQTGGAAPPTYPNPRNEAVLRAIEAQKDHNAALRRRIESIEETLAGEPCEDPDAEADLAPAPAAPELPDVSAAAKPRTEAAETASSTVLARGELVSRVAEATVMVLAPPSSTGTGFFIAPELVLTNRHVVASAGNGPVFVTGRGLGEVHEGRVVAAEGGDKPNSRDYAIIRVPGVRTPGMLPLAIMVEELQEVVAAGYPGLVASNDSRLRELLSGNREAVPEVVFSNGTISAIQNRQAGEVPIVAHSAAISGGNSGGPLVDRCGRAVGINSFIRVRQDQGTNAGFALAATDIVAFLADRNVPVVPVDTACAEGD